MLGVALAVAVMSHIVTNDKSLKPWASNETKNMKMKSLQTHFYIRNNSSSARNGYSVRVYVHNCIEIMMSKLKA